MNTKIESIAPQIERLLKSLDGEYIREFFPEKSQDEPMTIKLELRIKDFVYNCALLHFVLCHMVVERSALEKDPRYDARFLRDTTFKGIYSLDRLHATLPDFRLIKSLSVRTDKIICLFTEPLDIMEIRRQIQALGLVGLSMDVFSRKQTKVLLILLDNRPAFEIGYNFISLLFGDNFVEYHLRLLTELITLVHEERITRAKEQKTISLHEYLIYMEMSAPQIFERVLIDNLSKIRSIIMTNDPEFRNYFHETRPSQIFWRTEGRRFALNKNYLVDHLEYIVYVPRENKIVIRFSLPFDTMFISELTKLRMGLVDEEPRLVRNRRALRKGGRQRGFWQRYRTTVQNFVSSDGVTVAQIQGNQVIIVDLSDENAFNQALKILEMIYYGRYFISGWFETTAIKSDLIEYERYVIKNVDTIVRLYNFFISESAAADYYGEVTANIQADRSDAKISFPEPLTAVEWLNQTLAGANENDFPERLHCVFIELKTLIDKYIERFMSRTKEEKLDALQHYSRLSSLISLSESFLNQTKPKAVV
ncbi:MAG: hypothetical protein NUV82_04365 [Candidatus Komeilibacteria bacterium]|nr:hypothetical protein [Candidatus Komeilibacteria bacterium]